MHSVQRAQPALGGIQTKAPGYLEPQSSWGPWRAPFLTVEGKVLAIYQQPVKAAFGSGLFRVGVKPEAGKVCPSRFGAPQLYQTGSQQGICPPGRVHAESPGLYHERTRLYHQGIEPRLPCPVCDCKDFQGVGEQVG